jgi:hypothetical protein
MQKTSYNNFTIIFYVRVHYVQKADFKYLYYYWYKASLHKNYHKKLLKCLANKKHVLCPQNRRSKERFTRASYWLLCAETLEDSPNVFNNFWVTCSFELVAEGAATANILLSKLLFESEAIITVKLLMLKHRDVNVDLNKY